MKRKYGICIKCGGKYVIFEDVKDTLKCDTCKIDEFMEGIGEVRKKNRRKKR